MNLKLFDRQSVSSRNYTRDGYLDAEVTLSRTGVQHYTALQLGLNNRNPNEMIGVYRPPEEVFKPDSLQSFAYLPVTMNHPNRMVDADTAKKYFVGLIKEPATVFEDRYLKSKIRVTDRSAIKKIESGKVEVSVGYLSDIVAESGTADGIEYEFKQTNIIPNHLAIVDAGRCGPACKIHDSQRATYMKIVKINGIDFEIEDQAAQAVEQLNQKLADSLATIDQLTEEKQAIETKIQDSKTETETLKSECDKIKAQLDDSLTRIPTPEQLDQLVANRVETIEKAKKIKPDFVSDSKDCETVRKEIVEEFCKDVQIDAVSADYIRARFDALSAQPAKQGKMADALQGITAKLEELPPSERARQQFMEKSINAWKGK